MKFKFPLLTACLASLVTTSISGAEINWTVHDITGDVTDVSTSGSPVLAHGGADYGTANIVDGATFDINGVTFDDGFVFDSPSHLDTIGSRAGVSSTGDNAAYYTLLTIADRKGSGNATFTFSGLTIGNSYEIQVWHADNVSTAQVNGLVLNNGGIVNNPTHGTAGHATLLREVIEGGTGQYAIGTFVADATSQQFLARAWGNLTTTPSAQNNTTVNAVQLRDLGVVGPDEEAPTPNPMTWASVPTADSDSSISMTATTATDDSGVEYFFDETSGNLGGTDSGWQDSPSYTDDGLSPETTYSYTVTARDKAATPNATDPSTPAASATTEAADTAKPSPNPMSFAVAPAADSPYAISMTATTATDDSGVEYFFDETSGNLGGTDSGWQDSASYTDDGLEPNTLYTYTVTARDKSTAQNTTDPSSAASATTEDIDNDAPMPDPMIFAVVPTAVSSSAITMTADTATDDSGVEYYFTETSGNTGGDDSGWQDSVSYTDTGLLPDTEYSYTVTARDKGPLQNETDPSSAVAASTHPTATITWAANNITNDVGNVSQNGTLHDARNGAATASQYVNGTVFESAENGGNLFDSLFGNDTLQERGYGSVVTALSYQTFLRLGQRSGRPTFNDPPRIASTEDWATVNFTGLTVGNIYEVQIWASDVGFSEDGVVQRRVLLLGDGSGGAPVFGTDTQLFYEVDDFGAGQYGTGTFVAVAPTQSFNVQVWDNLDSTPVARTQDHMSNGWQIRDLGPSVTDYDEWASTQGWTPGDPNTGANDDFDGDGLTNDEERKFGLNSADPSSNSPFASLLDPTSGSFDYTRRTQSLTDLDYKVYYSTNLNQWFEDTGATQTPGTPSSNVQIVGVQVSSGLLDEPRLFVQLGAEVPVPPAPAPRLSRLWGSGNTITLNFTEEMDEATATESANYIVELDGGSAVSVIGATLGADGKTVVLTLGSALGINSSYNVAMSNLAGSGGAPLSGNLTAQFHSWDDHPAGIKVFILCGQSNMVGYGYTEIGGNPAWTDDPENTEPKDSVGGPGCLRYLAKNNGSYPEYDYTTLLDNPSDTDSDWKTRSDVKVWWEQGVSGKLNQAEGYGDLGPPFRGGSIDWFGPEYGFGQIIGDYYAGDTEAPVLIIKTAWGGHSLGGNFRPPSAVADRGGAVGASYDEIFANTRYILENLATKFPAADYPEFNNVGYRYQIVGFAFHQGYTDRVSPDISPEYQMNLPDFIHDVRGGFGKPDMPFVIASTGMATDFVEFSPYPNYTEVEQAQLWVVGDSPPAKVRSSDTRSFMESALNSPRNQAFHWHGNARSYFRVGKALGDDMVTLLSE